MKFIRYITLFLAAMLLLVNVPAAEIFADEEATEAVTEFLDDNEFIATDKTTLFTSEFEDGDFEGWSAFGGQCTLAIDNVHSCAGTSSLYVYDRKATWSGASINVTKYIHDGDIIHANLRLNASNFEEGATISVVLKTTDIYGADVYTAIETRDAKSGGWLRFEGFAEIPVNTIDAIIYIESSDINTEYYLDSVIVSKYGSVTAVTTAAKSPDDPEYTFSFEKTAEGWLPRGEATVAVNTQFAYSGKNSLYISDRKKTWNGATVRLDRIEPGNAYTYSAYVMYGGKEYETQHTFCIELQYNLDGSEVYSNIASKELQRGTWSKISGTFTVPQRATDIYFYVQTEYVEDDLIDDNDLMSFYIDNISIIETSIINRRELKQTLVRIATGSVILFVLGTIIVLIVLKSRKTRAALRTASLDFMTKAYNRNTFESLVEEFSRDPDKLRKLYITACDVNFLKYINDNYGHESGDRAIIRCAAILLRSVSKKGKVFRTGGDEFVCFSPENPLKKINDEYTIESNKYEGYPFSIACGTIIFEQRMPGEKPDIERLLAKADQEMYHEKQRIKKEFTQFSGMNTIKHDDHVVELEEVSELETKIPESSVPVIESEPLYISQPPESLPVNDEETPEPEETDVTAETSADELTGDELTEDESGAESESEVQDDPEEISQSS